MYHAQDSRSAYQQKLMAGMMNSQHNPFAGRPLPPVELASNLAWGAGIPLPVILACAPSIQKRGARIFLISKYKDGTVKVGVELPTSVPRVQRSATTA
jgi:hypothetical protein